MSAITLDQKIDLLEKRLRRKIEIDSGFMDPATQSAKLNTIFRHFNTDGDGFISPDEFIAALVRLNFVGVQREIEGLFARYDVDCNGFVSYEEFTAALFGLIPSPSGSAESRSAVNRVRAKITERGGSNGFRAVRRVLNRIDDNGNGMLDREEMKYGLEEFGVELSDEDLDKVMDVFDVNKDGQITLDEFFRGLRGSLSARRRELILLAYDQFDVDDSGEVNLEDMRAAYDTSHHPEVQGGSKTSDEVLTEFLGGFEGTKKDGVVTRGEFLDYYKDISASITDDDYFELMIRNAWRIMGGAGTAGNTANTRVLVVHKDGSQEVVAVHDDLGHGGDLHEIKRRLIRQGVTEIDHISLAE